MPFQIAPMPIRRYVAPVLLIVAAAPALASGLTAQDIRAEIVGRRIYLASPLGGEFPLNYRRSGVVDGNGEALGLGKFVAPKDSGRWWVQGDKLCQKFKTWYDGNPMCFDLVRTGPGALKWTRDNGQTGTARIGQPVD